MRHGLDTVPLPGDVSEAELAGIYLDVAALSVALGQAAHRAAAAGARCRAGDVTEFTFDYFANSRVLPAAGAGAAGVVARGP